MVSDIASILFYASWALVGFICECSSLTFQSILWCLLKLEIVACLHDSFASWWNILLHLWLEQSANTCICFCSDEKLMRQLDASPMQSCLFRKEMHKPIPPPPPPPNSENPWQYLCLIFFISPLSAGTPEVSFTSFSFRVMLWVFIQEHLLSLFNDSFPLPSNNVQAPLCLHLVSWDTSLPV